jgi:hypothetical protein
MSEHDRRMAGAFGGGGSRCRDSRSSALLTRYRWTVSSRGYMLTGRASTEIDPSEYFFLHVFLVAAGAQARRDSIPFDPFNSDIRVVRD